LISSRMVGPYNLEPGTMRVYVTNGPRNGLNIGGNVGPCPGTGDGGCWVVYMAFLRPLMTQTHTVPGLRLGPDLPRCALDIEDIGGSSRSTSLLFLYEKYVFMHVVDHREPKNTGVFDEH